MPNPTNHPESDQSSTEDSMGDRLESLMADMEQELERLDARPDRAPTVEDASDEDVEASAAQLMRELNEALIAADAEDEPPAEPEEQPEPESSVTSEEDLAALDEKLAARSHDSDSEPARSETLVEEGEPEVVGEEEPEAIVAVDEETEVVVEDAPAPARSKPVDESQAEREAGGEEQTDRAPETEREVEVSGSSNAPEPEAPAPEAKGAAVGFGTRVRVMGERAVRVMSLPLAVLSPTMRDYVGWFGIVTVINGAALWAFWLLFRT